MGKTHEALEWAEKEYGERFLGTTPEAHKTSFGPPPRQVSKTQDMECYQSLKTNLLSRYPNESIKTILFTGTAYGDGASTTAINFATAMAKDCALKVLLVDANFRTPSLHDVYKADHTSGLSDLLTDHNEKVSKFKKISPWNLYVLPCGGKHSNPVALFESTRFDQFLNSRRKEFDYIILDAPPVLSFSESRALCAKVDGVVLVLGSGKTRLQVAQRAKKELVEAGGKVLGVVLNRRKYHIPEWIYKRL